LPLKRLPSIKREIRVLGVDDGVHIPRSKSLVPVIGAVFRGGTWLDGILSTCVKVDGFEVTEAVSKMVTASHHYGQLRVIMLSGITFAGFNVLDITKLNASTGLPIIVVMRKKPNLPKIKAALTNLSDPEERLKAIYNAGEVLPVSVPKKKGTVYMQTSGITLEDAKRIIALTSTRSNMPEPIRAAHLIASGISSCQNAN
jgi:uncharacterized protein